MTAVTFHRQIVLIIFTLRCGDRRAVLVDTNLISLLSQFSSLPEASDYCLLCHNGNKKKRRIKFKRKNETGYSRKSISCRYRQQTAQTRLYLHNTTCRHVSVWLYMQHVLVTVRSNIRITLSQIHYSTKGLTDN
jgi:hypothetical protein